MSAEWHRLSDVDPAARTAYCSAHQKVVPIKRSGHGWRCQPRAQELKRANGADQTALVSLRRLRHRQRWAKKVAYRIAARALGQITREHVRGLLSRSDSRDVDLVFRAIADLAESIQVRAERVAR